MAGNLTTAVATQQALNDPDREDRYIGLVSGDYLMVPQKHTEELAKALPSLDLIQGYLVPKDADPNLPIEKRAEGAVPGITYASMRVSVQPVTGSESSRSESSRSADSGESSSSSSSSSKKSSSGSSKGGTKEGTKEKETTKDTSKDTAKDKTKDAAKDTTK
jgi:hypothetical protein